MSSWSRLTDLTMRAAERAFGTRVRVLPMGAAQRYKNGVPDETRAVAVIVGEFARTPSSERLIPGKSAGSTGASMLTSAATLTVRAATMAGLGYTIREKDRVELIDEPGSPAFEVAEAHQIESGNLMALLTKIEGQS